MNYPDSWEFAPCVLVPEMLSSQYLHACICVKRQCKYLIIERHTQSAIYLPSASSCELSLGISLSNKTNVLLKHVVLALSKLKRCMSYRN